MTTATEIVGRPQTGRQLLGKVGFANAQSAPLWGSKPGVPALVAGRGLCLARVVSIVTVKSRHRIGRQRWESRRALVMRRL